MIPTEIQMCIDCRHCKHAFFYEWYYCKLSVYTDTVSGEKKYVSCYKKRGTASCKFEKRPTLFEKIKNIFKLWKN